MMQVMRLVNPIASVKRVKCDLFVGTELPETVVGDDKRLMQIALNVVGNAVKFTKEGSISVKFGLDRDPGVPDSNPVQGEQHCYVRVEVHRSCLPSCLQAS